MQTLSEIRRMLEEFGLAPQKRFGQNFLFDHNLLAKIVDLAEVARKDTVLEVGPGTGTLTEELLDRAGRVVSVEVDHGLVRLLTQRFADRDNLVLMDRDVLEGKHKIDPQVLEAVGPVASLVSNLPYNVATPIVAQCLISSWQAVQRPESQPRCRFDKLVFIVQQEVADRLVARTGSSEYGPVSVIISLLGNARMGTVIPNTAFWPKPQITSRAVRIDFDAPRARRLADAGALKILLSLVFNQRRKQIASVGRRKNAAFDGDEVIAALDVAGIEHTLRAEQVSPEQFLLAANALAGKARGEFLDVPVL